MTRRLLLVALPGIPLAAQRKSGQQKGPEVRLLEAAARVEDRRVNIDGRVKNTGDRPIRKLNIIFEILDADRNVLTRQQGPMEESLLQPGEESSFHAQIAWHARSVSFRVEFEDGSGRELRAENRGPFPIE